MKHSAMIIAAVVALATPAAAKNDGKLPSDAKPMAAAEVEAVHSGRTIQWFKANAFFAPDKTVVAFAPAGYYGEGTWRVNGNEFCYTIDWRATPGGEVFPEDKCKTFHLSAGKGFIVNTKAKDEYMNDVYGLAGEQKKLKKGDTVTAKVAAYLKKAGS